MANGTYPDMICVDRGMGISPIGRWWETTDPFMYVMPVTMLQFILFSMISKAISYLLSPLHPIKFVSNMLAGLILGPSFVGHYKYLASKVSLETQLLVRDTLAYVGLSFYMFIVSVKIDLATITRMGKKAFKIGMMSFGLPFLILIGLGVILHHFNNEFPQAKMLVALAFNLSVTASPNIASALDELELLTCDLGRLALSSSLLNDVLIWIFLGLTAVERQKHMTFSFVAFLFVCTLLAFIAAVLRPFMLWIIKKTPDGEPVKEIYVLTILVCVLVLGLATQLGTGNPLQGPILFGLIVPTGPPLGSTLTERVELIVFELIMPFFYLQMGAQVNFFSLLHWKSFAAFETMVVAGYVAKFLGVILSSLFNGMILYDSLKVGLFMSVRGIIDFVAYWDIRSQEMLTAESHAALALSAVAETLVIIPLIKYAYNHTQNRADQFAKSYARSLQRNLNESELRILSCIHNADDVPGIITLLEASNPAVRSPMCAYVVHLIHLIGQTVPSLTYHKQHRRRCEQNGCRHILTAFKNYAENSANNVTIEPFTMVAPLKNMHEGICRLARDKHVTLILASFFTKGLRGEKGSNFNSIIPKIQKFAPCTVGILVDRGSHINRANGQLGYHVLVLFIGGEDDREALAYGTRMLGHCEVTVTLLHILMKEGTDDELQRGRDDVSVDEFRLRTINNPRASYCRRVVEDWEEAIKSSRSSVNGYNLVITGRRQGTTSEVEQEIESWSENPELGIIGDMLASLGESIQVSVLVVQQCGNFDTATLTRRMQVEESTSSKFFSIVSSASASMRLMDFA